MLATEEITVKYLSNLNDLNDEFHSFYKTITDKEVEEK